MSRAGFRRGLAGAVVAAVLVGVVSPALAVDGVETAYWWTGGSAGAPPQVPAGGLYVSSNASGPQAVSAIRFTLQNGEGAPILHLKVAQVGQASTPAGGVTTLSVVACPAKGDWKASDKPGDLSAAPKADCSQGSAPAELSDDQKTLTVDLSTLAASGTVDIVLTPSEVGAPTGAVPGGPSTVWPSFDLALDKVTTDQIDAGTATGASDQSTPSFSGGVAVPGSAPGTMPAASGAFTAAQPSSPGLDQSPVVAPSGSDATGQAPQVAATGPVQQAAVQVPGEQWDRQRVVLVLLVVNIALYVWWDGQKRAASGRRPRRNLFDPPPPREEADAVRS